MSDVFTCYEIGLQCLLERLGKGHPRYADTLILQTRLLENIAKARRYGDTEIRRAERAQALDMLNQVELVALGASFNELCELIAAQSVAEPPASPISVQPIAGVAPAHTTFDVFISYSYADRAWVWDELLQIGRAHV